MNKFFRIAFANSGDRTVIPNAVDPSGNVSYTEGYGADYQLPKTDPDAKNIERDKMNDLFYEITLALQELQGQGVPDFITSVLNGGTAYSYSINALVRYSGAVYISLANTNTATPTDATKWALLPTAALIQSGTFVSAAAGGTADALTGAFTPAFTALGAQQVLIRAASANATTTPTFNPDGLGAETIVKANNLPLVAGDIPGAGAWLDLKRDPTLGKWVLLNPAKGGTVTSGSLTLGTKQSLSSGLNKDFTGLPAGITEINVSAWYCSTTGADAPIIQLGTSGGFLTTAGAYDGTANALGVTANNFSTGFRTVASLGAASIFHVSATLKLIDSATNTWRFECQSPWANGATSYSVASGIVVLPGVLTQVRFTIENGTTSFDGSASSFVNISYRP